LQLLRVLNSILRFNFLSDLSHYRQIWEEQSGSDAIEELTMTEVPAVRVRHPILVDNTELPAGTIGRLFAAAEQPQKIPTIIEWRVRYSAWTVFFSAIDGFIQRILSGVRLTDANTSHLQLTLELLASLISKDSVSILKFIFIFVIEFIIVVIRLQGKMGTLHSVRFRFQSG